MIRYIPLCIGIACSPSFGTQNGGFTNNNNSNSNSDSDNLFDTVGLPSLEERMDKDYCNTVDFDGPGATSYFMGAYTLNDEEEWIGKEQWILHPTDSWDATEGETCYVTWEMSASEVPIGGCPSCDLAISVSAFLNQRETTCPEGLWENEEQWSTTYDILRTEAESFVYFQSDGNLVGEGYTDSSAFNFLSEVSCSWF